ncbi:MAG: TRAP transporter small permease [Rhodobacteraceae bacterium]|nr:TRAP transporter small permease [Paracoccaceae bacterium]
MVPGLFQGLTQESAGMKETGSVPPVIGLLDRVLAPVALVCGGATLIVMIGLSVINVLIMRKALNAPIQGAEDIMILLLVVIVALSIPLGARAGSHIEIEVLASRMSPGFAKWSMILMKLLGIALLTAMTWRLWHAGQNAERFGETTQQLLISYEPFYYLLAISVALYALVIALDIWQLLRSDKVVNLKIDGGTA